MRGRTTDLCRAAFTVEMGSFETIVEQIEAFFFYAVFVTALIEGNTVLIFV